MKEIIISKFWKMALIIGTFCFIMNFSGVKEIYAAESDLPKVNWKMQCVYPPPENLFPGIPGAYGQSLMLAKMVEKASKGRFKIQVFHSGSLFKASKLFDAVSTGAIEMGYAVPRYWEGKMPEAAVEFNLPGSMLSYAEAKKLIWESDWLKILRGVYKKHGVYNLGNTEIGQYNMILKFPLHKVSDLKGKKLRATGITAKALIKFGGTPVKIGPAEQYIALQQGIIDGTVFPGYTGITYKFFEVAKYVTWPGIAAPNITSMIVNLEAYDKLPQKYKDLLNNTAKKWSAWNFDVRGPKADEYVMNAGKKDYKATMIKLSPETVAEFRKLSRPLWGTYAAKSDACKKLVGLLEKANK